MAAFSLTPPPVITLPADSAHMGGVSWLGARAIVLHHTAGTDSRAWLSTTSQPPVSVHVLIAKDGTITRIVPDGTVAYHVGRSRLGANSPNQHCYGIELENLGTGRDPYPDAQIAACGWQIAQWWLAHGVLPILTHALIDTTGKTDPRGLDLARVYRAALAWYDAPTAPTGPLPALPHYTTERPLMGVAAVSLATIQAAFPPSPFDLQPGEPGVAAILAMYAACCRDAGIDLVVAVAQMAHETNALASWWSQPPRRNLAGIGVTGEVRPPGSAQPMPPHVWAWHPTAQRWERGNRFERYADAVVAHVGRLLAYATRPTARSIRQQSLVATALSHRALAESLQGRATTLGDLAGTWASDRAYAEKLVTWANRLSTTNQEVL